MLLIVFACGFDGECVREKDRVRGGRGCSLHRVYSLLFATDNNWEALICHQGGVDLSNSYVCVWYIWCVRFIHLYILNAINKTLNTLVIWTHLLPSDYLA